MNETINVPVKLPNGATIHIEARRLGPQGETDVADIRELVATEMLGPLTSALEGIATWVEDSLRKVHPKKAAVEFGMEVGLESGQLTALLAKGNAKANLKITLEWENASKDTGTKDR